MSKPRKPEPIKTDDLAMEVIVNLKAMKLTQTDASAVLAAAYKLSREHWNNIGVLKK